MSNIFHCKETFKKVNWHRWDVTMIYQVPYSHSGTKEIHNGSGSGKKVCPNCWMRNAVRKLKCECSFVFPKKKACLSPPPPKKKIVKSNIPKGDSMYPNKHVYKLSYRGEIVSKAVLYGPFKDFEKTNVKDTWDDIQNIELQPINVKMNGPFWDLNDYIKQGWFK